VTTSSGRVILEPVSQAAIATAAGNLSGGDPTTEAVWVVFSPTTAGPEPWSEGVLTSASPQVVGGYVDNAFDTQRRRGTDATVRVTFT